MNVVAGLRGRAFGLVIFAILVVTIALLVVGYGLAVGLGVLAGLVLGFGVGLFAFFSTWQGRGQVTFGGGHSTFASWNDPHMGRPVAGPWTFSVALPRE